jgi:hypothetical protein
MTKYIHLFTDIRKTCLLVFEGYPMDEVSAIMGQPQRRGPHYAYYVAKEGPAVYLELNDVRQIGGRSGTR